MHASQRRVVSLPLAHLFEERGVRPHKRGRELTANDIRERLRMGQVQFVVVDVGKAPQWIPLSDCFDFFKRDVSPHLAEPAQRCSLDAFPNGYCYFASDWAADQEPSVVVLERTH